MYKYVYERIRTSIFFGSRVRSLCMKNSLPWDVVVFLHEIFCRVAAKSRHNIYAHSTSESVDGSRSTFLEGSLKSTVFHAQFWILGLASYKFVRFFFWNVRKKFTKFWNKKKCVCVLKLLRKTTPSPELLLESPMWPGWLWRFRNCWAVTCSEESFAQMMPIIRKSVFKQTPSLMIIQLNQALLIFQFQCRWSLYQQSWLLSLVFILHSS